MGKGKVALSIAAVTAACVLACAIYAFSGDPSSTPRIGFHYSGYIDRLICPSDARASITPVARDELKRRLPDLDRLWSKEGPALLASASRLTGKPFAQSEYDIPVFLCSALPGWGLPLMVPVNLYLRSMSGAGAWDDREFVDAVFHELLHMHVVRSLGWSLRTPLLKRLTGEAFYTKIHVHLYAVQKAVYADLGKEDYWARTVARAKTFPPEYSRAIDRVEQDGAQPWIEELRRNGLISPR